MLGDLRGRRALVTGAGGGIGRSIATVLARQGARVAVTDRNLEAARRTSEALGGDAAIALQLDVGSTSSVRSAFAELRAAWGHLDILVNNAAIASATSASAVDDSEADWDATFDVNVKGVVRCCDAVAGPMKERRYGRIVNLGSVAGHRARKSLSAYAVSKAAVLRYTAGLAARLAPWGITVNAVCPGAVWTPLQATFVGSAQLLDPELAALDDAEAFHRLYDPIIPLGRPQTAEEVAKAVAFLASDDAASITGQCLHVDGGLVVGG